MNKTVFLFIGLLLLVSAAWVSAQSTSVGGDLRFDANNNTRAVVTAAGGNVTIGNLDIDRVQVSRDLSVTTRNRVSNVLAIGSDIKVGSTELSNLRAGSISIYQDNRAGDLVATFSSIRIGSVEASNLRVGRSISIATVNRVGTVVATPWRSVSIGNVRVR